MRASFDQGDGSFELVLEKDERLDPGWNIPGVVVYREAEPKYTLVKDYTQIV